MLSYFVRHLFYESVLQDFVSVLTDMLHNIIACNFELCYRHVCYRSTASQALTGDTDNPRMRISCSDVRYQEM